MQSIASILFVGFLIALIVAIVFGVKWYKSRKDKSGDNYKKNKKRTIVTLVVMAVCLIGGSMAQNAADEEEQAAIEAQQAAIEAQDKKDYGEEKKKFTEAYGDMCADVEELSSDEADEWEDTIDNSGEDFDVDSTIDSIEDNHSDDIDNVEVGLDALHSEDKKIQNNSYASKKDKETIHNAYLSMKHFSDHATSMYGSYNDFLDAHNKMDQDVSDKLEELQDL